MTNFKPIAVFAFAAILALALLSTPAYAQTNTFTGTTLATAMTAGAKTACLTSASGVVQATNGAAGSFLWIEKEQMQVLNVTSTSATCFSVSRVNGSPVAHAILSTVLIGPGNWFQKTDAPVGTACTLSQLYSYPWINVSDGKTFYCLTSEWQDGAAMLVKPTAEFDAVTSTTGTTLTAVAGLVVNVTPGTYRFYINLPGISTGNTGVKYAFKYSTVPTSIESTARAYTASAVAVTHNTTTTDQTLLMDDASAVVINTVIEGTMVVAANGTVQLQAAQHTAHGDTVSVYTGASMAFTRM